MPRIKKELIEVKQKQQRSILDFTTQQRQQQQQRQRQPNRSSQVVTIKSETITNTTTENSSIVYCPICNEGITHLDLRERTDHVDTCLVRVTFVEKATSTSTTNTTTTTTTQQQQQQPLYL